jgi:PAS domain-containing protein
VVNENTTEREIATDAVRQTQEQYYELVNTIDGIVWEADARTFQFIFVSDQAERILGYPVRQWIEEPSFWKDHLYSADRTGPSIFVFKQPGKKDATSSNIGCWPRTDASFGFATS